MIHGWHRAPKTATGTAGQSHAASLQLKNQGADNAASGFVAAHHIRQLPFPAKLACGTLLPLLCDSHLRY
jgi:hypothetical protein